MADSEVVVKYGDRVRAHARAHHNQLDLELAMQHPQFARRQHQLLQGLADESRVTARLLLDRQPVAVVQVGVYPTTADLITVLDQGGYFWEEPGVRSIDIKPLLERIPLENSVRFLALYDVVTAELGYPDGGSGHDIFGMLERIGAKKLPPEAIAQLRFNCPESLLEKWVLAYMEPIEEPRCGGHMVLAMGSRHYGGLHPVLTAGSDYQCNGDTHWVCCREEAEALE